MTPQEKLEEIKEAGLGLVDPDKYWLIARVEQLEAIVHEINFYMCGPNTESKLYKITDVALNTGPKVSSSLSEKPE